MLLDDHGLRPSEAPLNGALTRAVTTAPPDGSMAALAHARGCLEASLEKNDAWRALKQLQAREDAGEWLDVMEGDVLRDRLTVALSAEPDFMAWQFVDAAIACLDAGHKVKLAPLPANSAESVSAAAAAALQVDSQAEHEPAVALEQADVAAARVAQRTPQEAAIPQMRELSTRIPTLLPHDGRFGESRDATVHIVPAAVTPVALQTMESADTGSSKTLGATADADSDEDDHADDTQFDSHAVGIEEADVQIIIRPAPADTLVDARLPPSPLTERGGRLPRASRSTTVKWADQVEDEAVDFRPVGSAMDEAQVTIIDVAAKGEAQSRAERRALGVAPDRETQMRRFLKALSGE